MSGPLASLKVVEFTGLGPAPLAGQLLADLGAQVIAIDRASAPADQRDVNRRGKRSVALNLKSADGVSAAKRIIDASDVLIEGFRPGVMEKLGLGPSDLHDRLIYGRMTGWGQDGPLAKTAGHDINYLAVTGALHAMGKDGEPPIPPLNLVADFGGGSMFLIFGILAAVIERGVSGKGQTVDAAMIDGVPAMMGLIHTMLAQGAWSENREANLLDGAAPFYRCYECADGKFLSVGPLEPQFFAQLVKIAGLPETELPRQNDKSGWADGRAAYARLFRTRTRDEWAEIFDGTDACVAPVLTFSEAPDHPQNKARQVYYQNEGVLQAAPAPRFSRTAPDHPDAPAACGAETIAVLEELGYSQSEISQMRRNGTLT